MIGVYLSLASLVFVIVMFFRSRGRVLVNNYQINTGQVCKVCKERMPEEPYDPYKIDYSSKTCVSCQRDSKLGYFLTNKVWYIKLSNDFYKKTSNILIFSSIALDIGCIFYSPLNIPAGILLFIGLWMSYHNYMSMSRKKKTQSDY